MGVEGKLAGGAGFLRFSQSSRGQFEHGFWSLHFWRRGCGALFCAGLREKRGAGSCAQRSILSAVVASSDDRVGGGVGNFAGIAKRDRGGGGYRGGCEHSAGWGGAWA